MSIISSLFIKVYRSLFPNSDFKIQSSTTHFLVVFIRNHTDILLEQVTKDPSTILPFVFPVSPICDVSSETSKLKRVFKKMFNLTSEDISLSFNCVSLQPLHNEVYYTAVIDIDGPQAHLLESNPTYQIHRVPQSFLYLNRDNNFLYRLYEFVTPTK